MIRSEDGKTIRKSTYIFLTVLVLLMIICGGAARADDVPQSLGKLGPIKNELFHVQGVAVATDTIFITSYPGFIWKFNRKTMRLISWKRISEPELLHPSGLQFDGKYLWLAIAEYTPNSSALVMKMDPAGFKVLKKFKVADHIGLVASDGRGIVYGGNWDAKKFYVWDENGKLIATHDNPTVHGYQDCKLRGEQLICSGGGFVDFIDTETWKVKKSFAPGNTPGGNKLTREGMDFVDGTFYFAPDDGAGTYIYFLSSTERSK